MSLNSWMRFSKRPLINNFLTTSEACTIFSIPPLICIGFENVGGGIKFIKVIVTGQKHLLELNVLFQLQEIKFIQARLLT